MEMPKNGLFTGMLTSALPLLGKFCDFGPILFSKISLSTVR